MKIMAGAPRCTPELKQRAVELCRKSDAAYAEAARGPGVGPGSLSSRVKRADRRLEGDPKSQNPFQTAEGLRKLRRESERLKRENEVILKAGALFAGKAP